MKCSYPECDCAISFPDSYKPSEATECPACIQYEDYETDYEAYLSSAASQRGD